MVGESGYSGVVQTDVRRLVVVFAALTACGQGPAADETGSTGAASSSTGGGSSGTTGTGGAPTTGAASEATSAGSSSVGVEDSSGDTGGTGSTGDTGSSGASEGSSGGDETTGGVCDALDVVSYNYINTVDLGMNGLVANYFNAEAGELVFVSVAGEGVRTKLDGTKLGEVTAPASLGTLGGATYDAVNATALLIDHDCQVVEADALTLAEISVEAIDVVKFELGMCAGLALGPGEDVYIANFEADEVVVLTRDLMDEVARFDVKAGGIDGPEGIARIPGSDNFLIASEAMAMAGIFAANGEVVVPASEIGGGTAPLVGGGKPDAPDGLLSVCANGQVWLCDGLLQTECRRYAPEGGGADVCACAP